MIKFMGDYDEAYLKSILEQGISYFERTGSLPATDWMRLKAKKHGLSLMEINRFFKDLYEKRGHKNESFEL